MPLLDVRNLSILFGDNCPVPVVNDISFSLERGETLGVVGESGSGKTLTGLAIMGLTPTGAKVKGKITISSDSENININLLSEKERNKFRGRIVSMIFQDPMTSLNPSVRCGKQVDEILKTHTTLSPALRFAKVIQLFEEVRLPDPKQVYKKYPYQLSGGQLQRVMISIAIACNPLILIADEPTTALDVTVQKSIIELLIGLKNKYKISVIFISHNLDIVSEISSKIMVMFKGRLLEYGTAKQILSEPEEEYTKGLIACRPNTGKRLERLLTVEDFIENENIKPDIKIISADERKNIQDKIYAQAPVLKINNLNSWFILHYNFLGKPVKSFHALKDINLQIWKGETVGLVGESGSGKTTLGKILMRLIEKFDGNISYNGKNVSILKGRDLLKYRKTVQLVFQDPYSSLNPNHTIGYSIKEPMIVHNLHEKESKRKEKVFDLMKMTGLNGNFFNRYPHQLSGGQRQRVCIARALALQPEVLICDEAVSSLDVSIQANILNLLNDLKKQLGLTYIFISHDLAVVKYMSDRIFVMKNGQIIEEGEADALYANPRQEYTKTLIEAAGGLVFNL
jgi:peptide/nickel transport system ATP-binding protein